MNDIAAIASKKGKPVPAAATPHVIFVKLSIPIVNNPMRGHRRSSCGLVDMFSKSLSYLKVGLLLDILGRIRAKGTPNERPLTESQPPGSRQFVGMESAITSL